jgi:hypothetical protein
MADVNKAVNGAKLDQVVADSVQSRAHQVQGALIGGGSPGLSRMIFWRGKTPLDVPAYGYGGRAVALRRIWRMHGADIIASALAVMIQKVQATSYVIEGPQRTVAQAQQMIDLSNLGTGFLDFTAKWVTDFSTQDNGPITELVGPGTPLRRNGMTVTNLDGTPVIDVTQPLVGKPLTFSNLDSIACERTGVFETPIRYYDINGAMHLMHRSRVHFTSDMPQPDELLFGYGFCALSRCISMMQYAINWATMRNESLDNMPPLNITVLENLNKETYEDEVKAYEAEREAIGERVLRSVLTLVQQDPTKPTDVKLIPIRQLWESFDEQKAFQVTVNTVAMAFGLDPQELAPLQSSSMGSGAQSSVLDEKARGKGHGNILAQLEAFMRSIIPASCTFRFDRRDDEEDLLKAQIRDTKTKTVIALYTGSPTSPGSMFGSPMGGQPSLSAFLGTTSPTPTSLIDRDEARRLLLYEVPEWADIIDPNATLRQEVSVDELDPAIAEMQVKMYGPKVRYVSESRQTITIDQPRQKSRVVVAPVTSSEIDASLKRLEAMGIDVETLRPKQPEATHA